MSQPPYGVPPQQGGPQGPPQPPPYGQPGQAAPPPGYLGGQAPQFAGAPGPFGGAQLAPPSKPRTVGLVMGLITVFGLLLLVAIVAIITLNN